jgi:hypothetical protein
MSVEVWPVFVTLTASIVLPATLRPGGLLVCPADWAAASGRVGARDAGFVSKRRATDTILRASTDRGAFRTHPRFVHRRPRPHFNLWKAKQ